MPPAMVELRPPTAAAAAQISNNGEIPAPPSPPLVDLMDPSNLPPPSSSRLSKPRFVKVRKHQASTRVRTAAVADDAPGFNPFLSGGAQVLGDRLNPWKPFVAGAETGPAPFGPQNTGFVFGAGSGTGESAGMSDAASFAFGAAPATGNADMSVKRASNLNPISFASSGSASSGSFESIKPERADFVFDASTKLGSDNGNDVPGNADGRVGGRSGNSDEGSASLASLASDELGKLKLQTDRDEGRPKFVEKDAFVFGGRRNVSSEVTGEHIPSVFGHNLSRNSSLDANDASFFSELPDAMGKLKLQSGKENDTFVFGESTMAGGDSVGGISLSGSGLQNSSRRGQSSAYGAEEQSISQLHDQMMKMKLQNAGKEDGADKAKQANHKSRGGNDVSTDGNLKSDSGAFVFESLNRNLSLGSDESLLARLPDEIMRMNLQNTHNEGDFHKAKQANPEKSTFTFGDTAANKLPDEMMKKLNIGKEERPTINEEGSTQVAAGAFVFGGDVKTTSVANQTSTSSFSSLNNSTSSGIADDIGSAFVFGSGSQASACFSGTVERSFSDDIRKLKIKTEKENSVGSTDQASPQDGTAAAGDVPFKFSFQAGKTDIPSSMGAIPQAQMHGLSRPSSMAPSSSYTSSTNPYFPSLREGQEVTEKSRTKKQDTFGFSGNLFTSPHQNMSFSLKGESKGTQTRKRRGKLRQPAPVAKQFISKENIVVDNMETEAPCDYSPMDYSPYHENLATDQCSAEASVESDESIHVSSHRASTDSQISASVDEREEYLVTAAQRLGINDGDLEHGGLGGFSSKSHHSRNFSAGSCYVDEQSYGLRNGKQTYNSEGISFGNDSFIAKAEAEPVVFSSTITREGSEGGRLFSFAASSEDCGNFATSASAKGQSSVANRNFVRKRSQNSGQVSCDSIPSANVPLMPYSPSLFPAASCSVHSDPPKVPSGMPFLSKSKKDDMAAQSKIETSQESKTVSAASTVAEEACEKWRLRGNQAYANGFLSKAEDYYTRGINLVSQSVASESCLRALMLCYSNRAATRMSLGRMREAISDCKMAVAIDPEFLRAQARVANCHLALGEFADALKYFEKCLQSKNCDKKIITEASEGLKKAQKVAECIDKVGELLTKRTMDDAAKALEIILEALSISQHSEFLIEMKAAALLKLRNYEEVIQLCEQTLDSAKMNSVTTGDDCQLKDEYNSEHLNSSESLWRWRMISKSYFCLGKLEEALELLQKLEKVKPTSDKFGNMSQNSSTSLSVTISELLRLKAAGNEAFQSGRHLEAVEHYTSALAISTESRPFTAICFCNRAAAYQALGQITDAIADCSLAIALDASYKKAISRRATLHEMIRDYDHAANDLNRLISLLEKQLEDKDAISGTPVQSTGNYTDLKRARQRLFIVEEEARKEIPLDMYMILGIEPSSSAADVKKAYRKAALRHHPDKAGYFLTKSENVDDGLWREVAAEVYTDADRLFKMIGEAYTILSDPTKRLEYDAEEELRTLRKGYDGSGASKPQTDNYSGQYNRNANRWSHGSSNQRWSESSRSNW